MQQDLSTLIKFETLYNEATRSADQSEVVADVSGYDSQVIVVDVTGYTDGTTDFTLVVSDDDVSYTEADSDIADSLSVSASGDTGVHYLSYSGSDPYVGVKTATTGTTTGATWAAHAIGTDPQQQPVR